MARHGDSVFSGIPVRSGRIWRKDRFLEAVPQGDLKYSLKEM